MSEQSKFHYLLDEEVTYTDEDLFNLSGIRALHPKQDGPEEFLYMVEQISQEDESIPTLHIFESRYFYDFKVRFDFTNRVIDILMCVKRVDEPRVYFRCLKHQVEHAMRWGFLYIKLFAEKKEKFFKLDDNKYVPAIGYKVFGKYGYMMYVDKQVRDFVEFMEGSTPPVKYLHQIYETDQETSKLKWDEYGWKWHGVFRLSNTKSVEILNNCN